MDNKQKTIFVYDDWSREFPVLMGRLYVQCSRGEEVFSFEYENSWLKNNNTLILDPDLSFYGGKQYVFGNKKQFGLFMDSEPDRWGRMLLKRRENVIAKREGRAAKSTICSVWKISQEWGHYVSKRRKTENFWLITKI